MANDTRTLDLDDKQDDRARDLLAQALDDYDAAWLREYENQVEGLEDLKMLAGEQWDELLKAERDEQGRPSMTENRLPQFVRQITGDIRQMRPSIKAVAVNSEGDPETAEVIEGMIRYIETRSMASAVYFRAADSQVAAGMGAFRITTEYASESTMDQEIRIAPIEDGLSVLFDPDAILPDKTDGRFCFVPVDISRKAFRKRYPDAKDGSDFGDQTARSFQGWYGEDYVRVAEYWYKEEIERTLLVLNGQVKDLTDEDPDAIAEAEQMVELASQQQGSGMELSIEKRPGTKVRYCLMSGSEILEGPTDWPGRYIPIVPLVGEEIRIGRRIIRHGAVRHARDPQRLLNYMISAHAEGTALQPKAPFLVTEKNVQQYEDEWSRANSDNQPYLPYTPDPANGNRPPERVQPPVSSPAVLQGIQMAAQGLQATTGIYNSSLGAASNETSGKAISARQREGDTGTYVYTEHFGQALQLAGKIIADLVPHIYDTTREMRCIGEDGSEQLVHINKPVGLAMAGDDPMAALQRYENDVTVGAYDVVIEMGPSYNTRREEARDGLLAFIQASPQLAPVLMDLVAKMQDWPLADEVRERLELMLPPPIRAQIAEKRGEPPAPPPPPPPPSPEQQAQMAAQQRQQQLDAMKHQIEMGKLQVAGAKVNTDMQKIGADQQRVGAENQRSQIELAQSVIDAKTRMHEATAGVHVAHAQAQATAPANDPRIDQLTAHVRRLEMALGEIGRALSGGQGGPQAAPAPDGAGMAAPAAPAPAMAPPQPTPGFGG